MELAVAAVVELLGQETLSLLPNPAPAARLPESATGSSLSCILTSISGFWLQSQTHLLLLRPTIGINLFVMKFLRTAESEEWLLLHLRVWDKQTLVLKDAEGVIGNIRAWFFEVLDILFVKNSHCTTCKGVLHALYVTKGSTQIACLLRLETSVYRLICCIWK